MRSTGGLLVEAWCCLAKQHTRVQRGRVTGAANLEANLSQQLAGIVNEPLFQVFNTYTRYTINWTGVDVSRY